MIRRRGTVRARSGRPAKRLRRQLVAERLEERRLLDARGTLEDGVVVIEANDDDNEIRAYVEDGWLKVDVDDYHVEFQNHLVDHLKIYAFGDSISARLSPALQGVMLACVMAAAMSSGDAVKVTLGGLFSQNIYATYVNPDADERRLVRVTRLTGLTVALISLVAAVLMRNSIVKTILDYFNILSLIGVSTAMGIVWRRMNSAGVFCGTIAAVVAFVLTRYVMNCPREVVTGVPTLMAVLGGVAGSLLTRPTAPEKIEQFFRRIYTPIGQEDKLDLPLDQIVPPERRWLTWGGLFLVKPSRQSWIGLVVTLGICLAAVLLMYVMLAV